MGRDGDGPGTPYPGAQWEPIPSPGFPPDPYFVNRARADDGGGAGYEIPVYPNDYDGYGDGYGDVLDGDGPGWGFVSAHFVSV
jgi:hypothetical protein